MALKINIEPMVEPIDLTDAKRQLALSVDISHPDDFLITRLITVARRHCENNKRAYITQTWDYYLDEFPDEDYIIVPLPPLQSVTYVKYKDTSGDLQTLDSDNYIVDIVSEPGRIALAYNESWPTTYGEIQDVQIRYICGYGDAATDVPEEIKQAILVKLTDLYEHRGDVGQDANVERAVESLLATERIILL